MPVNVPDAAATSRPSRARLVLVVWLCALSGILYLDRICMGQAVAPIQAELGLSNSEISYVTMAFTLAYGLFAVPAGRWGDKAGPRLVLPTLVIGWSVFTGLTGAATSLLVLLVVRFLFGAAEAGAFPNVAKVMSKWYPVGERGRVQGIMLAFAQVGAVVAPVVAAYTIQAVGWRWMFVTFGMVGFIWALGFWFWFRNDPADHPGVNQSELTTIVTGIATEPATDPGPVPWSAVFTNRGILVLGMIMILGAFYTYFFYTWFPKYLTAARGVENIGSGWLTSLVIGGSAVGMLLGGWIADRIPRWVGDPVSARRFLGLGCYLTAAACMFAGVRCNDPLALAGLWAASACAMHITLPSWWSVIIPQAGRHVGTIFGLTNGVGVLGALASQGFVGVFADWQASRGLSGREQWDPIFDVYVVVLMLGGVAWWLYRYTPLPEPEGKAEEERA